MDSVKFLASLDLPWSNLLWIYHSKIKHFGGLIIICINIFLLQEACDEGFCFAELATRPSWSVEQADSA